jgi:hypothetical protein
MGGGGKVVLTARLHRLHWIAGQRCFVQLCVINNSTKSIKELNISLQRSTVVFRPNPRLDVANNHPSQYYDPDSCQTATIQKLVAQNALEAGDRGTRCHASAKGWWPGVPPGEASDLGHYLLIPVSLFCEIEIPFRFISLLA